MAAALSCPLNSVKITDLLVCSLFQKEEIYLNLVLDFVPETVYRVARHYSKAKQTIPMLYIKVRQVGINLFCSLLAFQSYLFLMSS